MVVAVCVAAVRGLSGGADARRRVARLRRARPSHRRDELLASSARCRSASIGVMTNEVLLAIPLFIFMGVMLERSRIAEELLETMGRLFGSLRGGLGVSVVDRRHAARRRQGRGRRHHRDHGPDHAAGHAAPRLRQGARRRHGGGDRDAGADLPARHRAGAARRPALDRLSVGAAFAGQFRAVVGDGERSVRRRDRAGLRAGGDVHALSDLHGGVLPEDLARDPARSRRAARLRAGAPADRGAGRAARC